MVTTRIKPTDDRNKFLTIQPSAETPPAVVANCIATISHGIRALRAGRLNDRAIVTLVHDDTGVSRKTIQAVIDSLEHLEQTYLKPIEKRPQSTGPR